MRNKPKWYSILLLGIVLLLASSVLGCQAPPEDVIPLAVPGFYFVEKSDRVVPLFEGEDYSASSFFEPASSSKFQGKVGNLVVEVHKFKDETSAREFFSMFAEKEGAEEIQVDDVTAMLLYEDDMGLVTVFFQQGKLVIMSSAEGLFDNTTLEFTVPDEQVLKNAAIEGARAAARNL